MKNFDNTEEADIVVDYINARFKKGLNSNVFVIGLSGTGKSSLSQRVGELIVESRPKENLKMFIVDSLLGLLKAMREGKEGDIIIIEEVSVLFPSRRAMSGENVSIAKIFDTIRKRNLCLISNAPLWKSIDKHMRSMAHILIQTLNIDKKQSLVISKFYRLQTNPLSGKTYTHTMTRQGKDIQLMITGMPCSERWKEYEDNKDKSMNELYDKLESQQIDKNFKEEKKITKSRKFFKQVTDKQLETMRLLTIHNHTETARILGRKISTITSNKQGAEKKGWLIKDFEEGGNYDQFLTQNDI